jgi:tyrosinase
MKYSRLLKAAPAALLAIFLLPVCRPLQAAAEVLAVRNLDMTLDQARTTVTVEMPAALRETPGTAASAGKKLSLYLEGIEWGRTGSLFEVYANLPPAAAPSPEGAHYLGTLSSNSPQGGAGTGASVSYDITNLVRTLAAEGAWNGQMTFTFLRRSLLPPPGQEKPELRPRIPESPAVTRVRRVKIVRE